MGVIIIQGIWVNDWLGGPVREEGREGYVGGVRDYYARGHKEV